jgi:hypothetical protein
VGSKEDMTTFMPSGGLLALFLILVSFGFSRRMIMIDNH